jgi:hypothetical protein
MSRSTPLLLLRLSPFGLQTSWRETGRRKDFELFSSTFDGSRRKVHGKHRCFKCTDKRIIRFLRVTTNKKRVQTYIFSKRVKWVSGQKCTDLIIESIRVVGSPARDWGDTEDSKSDGRS